MLDRGNSDTLQKAEASDALQKMQEEALQMADGTAQKNECPTSTTYKFIINKVIENIYEPKLIKDSEELLNRYNCQIKSESDAVKFASKALEDLGDPYTGLHLKTEADMMRSNTSGVFFGIGMTLGASDSGPTKNKILDLAKGGAGADAGLKAGDLLIKLNGEDVSQMSVTDITSKIRSDKPEPLSLTVLRDGQKVDIPSFERRKIETKAVQEPEIKDGISHIKISTFNQEDTSDELKAALEKHPEAKAYIIDLRGNHGGLVSEAFRSLSLFIGEGKLGSERERMDGRDLEEGEVSYYKTDIMLTNDKIEFDKGYEDMPGLKVLSPSMERHPDLVNKPVVVLVDGETASASEIFAGAMKDLKEGTLIGTKTYGKGIGQTHHLNMPEGSILTVTNLRLFTPSGHWVGDAANNRIGIKPDIELKENEDALEASVKHLKKLLASKEIRKAS